MHRRLPLVLALVVGGGASLGQGMHGARGDPPPPAAAPPPTEPVGWREPPPDPIEVGSATLAMTLVAEGKRAPLYGSAALWRLDAPGNEHWLPGDRLQASVTIEAGRGEVTGLPEGRYRVVYDKQRGASEDPPAFDVRGSRTEVTLRIAMPRRFEGSLRLVDERGVPLRESALLSRGFGGWKVTSDPAWRRAREVRRPGKYWLGLGGGGWGTGGGHHRTPKSILSKDGLFAVGSFEEPTKATVSHVDARMVSRGRNDVEVRLGDGPTAPTTHLGVALPLALVLQRFALPDGSPVFGSAAMVEATCVAELVTEGMSPDRWRTLPIRVRVTIPGYEPLEVTANADEPSPMPPPWVPPAGKPAQSPW